MSFSLAEALAVCTATIDNRIKSRTNAYVLYYSNDNTRYDGKIQGFTIKQLITEFRELGTSYKYAFITKVDNNKVLRFYNRDVSKKFFSMTRVGKRAK